MTVNIIETSDAIKATLEGRLDTAASADFSKEMQPLIDSASKKIVLDLAKLDFISSSGLRLLLALRKESIAAGGSIILSNVQDNVKQVFALTGFTSLFEFE